MSKRMFLISLFIIFFIIQSCEPVSMASVDNQSNECCDDEGDIIPIPLKD